MLNDLIMIVLSVANCINERDFDEYDKDLFSFLNIPQNPSYLKDIMRDAKNSGLKVLNKSKSKSYIKISADKDTWIRFNLYTHNEPYYGDKGDVNSIDMTRNVYEGVIAPYRKTLDVEN